MKKNLIFFHVIFFLIVVLVSTSFVFYQLFVDVTSRKIRFSSFIKLNVLSQATASLFAPTIKANTDNLYTFDQSNTISAADGTVVAILPEKTSSKIFVVQNKKYVTQIDNGSLLITDIYDKKITTIPLELGAHFEVLGWQNEHQIILSKKSTQFSIIRLDTNNQEKMVLVSDIQYSGDTIFNNYTGTSATVLYPSCTPECYFNLFDLEKNQIVDQIPAFTDPGHAATLKNLRILLYDEVSGFVAYEVPERREMYVIDRSRNLLQLVRLENDRNLVQFQGYIPNTRQLLFTMSEKKADQQTIALVGVNFPSIRILTSVRGEPTIVISPRARVYQVGNTLFDMNGKQIKNVDNGQLIPTF